MSTTSHVDSQQTQSQLSGSTSITESLTHLCTALILPSGGVLVFNNVRNFTLDASATFKLPCDDPNPILSPHPSGNSTVIGFPDAFYSSISPQIFTLAAATVISYVLVILVFITPRTFFVGGPGGGSGFLGRRAVINGSYGSSLTVGIGRRPLLQKIATITVAASLTIATADTFRVAKDQYELGYTDARWLVDSVVASLEIRIVRVISDTFIWLAQVQTLIRLFPRHKEKVTIKWLGFALVLLDTIFSIWDSFGTSEKNPRPRSFQDAVAALNYLFELAISLIYASCVIYYSLSKRRFAFWHPKMRNVCLVALLSLVAVLIPVVFFVIDLSLPKVAGWGEYIRWVGAAAASVVVWEWVERVETLERDERKDGILGREIFDGDEMLDTTSSGQADWPKQNSSNDFDGTNEGLTEKPLSRFMRGRIHFPVRKRRRAQEVNGVATGIADGSDMPQGSLDATRDDMRPQEVLPPPSRSDTVSITSTIYAVRYHNLTSPSPGLIQNTARSENQIDENENSRDTREHLISNSDSSTVGKKVEPGLSNTTQVNTEIFFPKPVRQLVQNPFKRRRVGPPAEVIDAQLNTGAKRSPIDHTRNLRDRFGAFASTQRGRMSRRTNTETPALPITIIPAPRVNQRTWSPDERRGLSNRDGTVNLIHGLETENENSSNAEAQPNTALNRPGTTKETQPHEDLSRPSQVAYLSTNSRQSQSQQKNEALPTDQEKFSNTWIVNGRRSRSTEIVSPRTFEQTGAGCVKDNSSTRVLGSNEPELISVPPGNNNYRSTSQQQDPSTSAVTSIEAQHNRDREQADSTLDQSKDPVEDDRDTGGT